MISATAQTKKKNKSRYADDKQKELYKKFPPNTFLGNESNMDHFFLWMTFFRRNLHRFASDYLGLSLYWYQAILLYLMGVNRFIFVIASRASAKSFIIALYACCRCILYPGSQIVLSAAKKGQSKLLVSEKIQKELMSMSPTLRKEISKIVVNQNDITVFFRSGSKIAVVVASENGRGHRSNVIVREECRQIKKDIDDSILSPFQIVRQPPYRKLEYYAGMAELVEQPIDIYITSSWFDNGHWMWPLFDSKFDEMVNGEPSVVLGFDESIALKHGIKTPEYFASEAKKQDPTTWALEFLNLRLKESQAAYFSYEMLGQNQTCKQPFYPRRLLDFKSNKRNQFDLPKQKGEIRIVACDMAFIENKKNDNSIFTCMRLLPESMSYSSNDSASTTVSTGYRRIVPYIESMQGGEIRHQATRIRELYEDFKADYIVLDTRNSGIAIYDCLARTLYDEDRQVEYAALTCMNDDSLANRIIVEGAEPRIYAINASQKLNSDIAIDFRRVLSERKIDFLVSFKDASEDILPNINEYMLSEDADTQIFYERPFLETQELFSETISLMYEKKSDTGVIVVREQGSNRKDRYTSCSYGSYFASLLERDLLSGNDDYDFVTFIN